MTSAERLIPAGLVLGEGPIRLDDHRYACVDIRQGTILTGTLDGDLEVVHRFDSTVSAICLLDDGGLLAATGRGVHIVDHPEHAIDVAPSADDIRLNDGKADPAGRFIAGTMADPPRPGAGTLWSFADNATTPLLEGVTISNGLCWNDNGDTLYYIDTPTQCIAAFDYDVATGTISDRRIVATMDEGLGSPDGMTIDTEGGLWVAMWGGASVLRYDDGKITDRVELPTRYPTCPVFVGHDHGTLLITTASEPDDNPGAGDIYVARPGAIGSAALSVKWTSLFDPSAPSTC